jgi:hypothetical protein
MLEFIDVDVFEKTKLSELFTKYLPQFKHSNDWITAFSVNELKQLGKVDDEILYGTKLESVKMLISKFWWGGIDSLNTFYFYLAEEQSHDFDEVIQLNEEKKTKQNFDDRCCRICMELPMDCVYFDCKHICSCMNCAEKLDKCPVCRHTITQRVKVIIS